MPFHYKVKPEYRDADPDGLVGLRGYAHYCQDAHTNFMLSINKGNDVLPKQYGAGWVYTRYRVRLFEKAGFSAPVAIQAWMVPYHQPVLADIDLLLTIEGRPAAEARMECCVFSLARRRPIRFSAIELPETLPEDIQNTIPDYFTVDKTAEGMTERYQRTVRYSDLDVMGHMNNQRYIEMFADAYPRDFWERLGPRDMQINFLSQSMEGETLSVRTREENGTVTMAAAHEDGRLAAMAVFR